MKRSPLLPIFLIVLVDVLGLTIILPLLPFYAERYGASPVQVGLLSSVYAVCQLVSGPLLGRMSDRTGRKPLLLVSQLGTFIGFLVLANARVLWVVFLSRVIDGATAGNLSLAQAYIADVTAPKDRAKSFALIGIAFGLGFLVGPLISGLLAHGYGPTAPVYLAAALSATSVLCTATLLPRNPQRPAELDRPPAAANAGPVAPGGKRLAILDWGSYVAYFKQPGLARLLVQFFLFALAFAAFVSGFSLFAERRLTWHGARFGPREVGFVFGYAGLLGIILQGGLIGRLVRRFGEHWLIISGFAAAIIGYGLLAVIGLGSSVAAIALPLLVIASTISAYGSGVLRPNITSLVTQHVARDQQGTILGLTQSLLSVAQIVSPAIGGLLIEHDLLAAWGLWPALLALGGLVLGLTGKEEKGSAPTAATA